VRFEVSHLAEDCLADAYERLVPILRRTLSPAPLLQSVDRPNPQRSPLRRRQSGRVYQWPSRPGCPQTSKPPPTRSPAHSPRCVLEWPTMGLGCQTSCSLSMRATVGRL